LYPFHVFSGQNILVLAPQADIYRQWFHSSFGLSCTRSWNTDPSITVT